MFVKLLMNKDKHKQKGDITWQELKSLLREREI